MTRQKLGNEGVRKLIKLGKTSLSVTIPISFIKELKWREKQKVVIEKKGKTLVISDWKK